MSSSDRVVQVLDDAAGDFLVTAELDAAGTGLRSAAGQPGEQHAVQPDGRRRLFSPEVVHHPGATVDQDADGACQRTGQLESDP